MAPGPRFSTTTSASLARRSNSARPRSLLRFSVTAFLLALRRRKNQESFSGSSESPRRVCSPPGGSILITSAPNHASVSVQLGPASHNVKSRTRIPSSARPMIRISPFVTPLLVSTQVSLPEPSRPRPARLHVSVDTGQQPIARLQRRHRYIELRSLPYGIAQSLLHFESATALQILKRRHLVGG